MITEPKVLFDKTLKFLLVMRGNSSCFQAFIEFFKSYLISYDIQDTSRDPLGLFTEQAVY